MQERLEKMRVIGGKYRHRLLYWPNDNSIRPTKDRIREAIFSALGELNNKSFLDLFSGSGAIGIEALSRGSNDVYFVDSNVNAIKCISENLKSLEINEDYHIIKDDYQNVLEMFKKDNKQFDIVFLDPPYQKGRYIDIVFFLLNNNIVKEDGIIITESDKELEIEESLFRKVKLYKYGEIIVTFFRR